MKVFACFSGQSSRSNHLALSRQHPRQSDKRLRQTGKEPRVGKTSPVCQIPRTGNTPFRRR